MVCPICGSEHVTVSVVSEVKEKRKKGLLYWVTIGWIWEPLAWLFLTPVKFVYMLFGKHHKVKSKTVTYAVCQDCGHKWKVNA